MKKYWFILLNAFNGRMIYRGNFLIGIFNVLLQVGISMFMWIAVYRSSGASQIAGFNFSEMMAYLMIVNLLSLLFTFTPLFRFGELVHSGKLTAYLLRPINIFTQELFEYLGENAIYVVGFLFLLLVWGTSTQGILTTALMLLITGVTILMFYLLIMLIGLSSFWLVQLWPLWSMLSAMFLLFCGRYFPLQALPSQYSWLIYNPFSLAANELSLMVIGKLSEDQLLKNLGMTVIWLIIFGALIKLIWRKGLRHYEGVGN